MPGKKHSKESIIRTLQSLARGLGKDTLSKRDVSAELSPSAISYHFGSLGNALEAAGLRRVGAADHFRQRGAVFSDEELFHSVLRVEEQVGHPPTLNEYTAYGGHSAAPFRDRFGRWSEALTLYRKWKAERPDINRNSIGGAELPPANKNKASLAISCQGYAVSAAVPVASPKAPAQLYGEPIDFRGLRHAPTNEQGVVYLFGMVSRELGFSIEAIQQAYPDCEAKYLYDRRRNVWAKARIEFEFKASHFREHAHDPDQCDYIVCWENDWPDCPVRVIELRKEILKIPSK
jgi:Homing endonuclease associated repeat